jgi:hypothetical protein
MRGQALPLPNNSYQLSYGYNLLGQLMSVTNPFGSQQGCLNRIDGCAEQW